MSIRVKSSPSAAPVLDVDVAEPRRAEAKVQPTMLRVIRHGPLARAISSSSSISSISSASYDRSIRAFSRSTPAAAKPLPPRPTLNDEDIDGSYLKGSGPGGQKINKTNSAVQLIHKPTGIVVKCQATRSRSQNQKIAREILAEKVEALEKGERSRAAIKAERARRKKASRLKKSRRKYRALEEERRRQEEQEDVEEDVEEDDLQKQGIEVSRVKPTKGDVSS
ncbi:hypothetical protein VTN02DRAFT_4902 [Thermoascus thermophilus]